MADLREIEALKRCSFFEGIEHIKSYSGASEFPTESIVVEALENNNFSRLNKCVVISAANKLPSNSMSIYGEPTDILFEDDNWHNYFSITNINETKRAVDFSIIENQGIRAEVKVVACCFLWFFDKKAKLASIIRKIANVAFVARLMSDLGYKSFFWLDRKPVAEIVIDKLSVDRRTGKKLTSRSLNNYLMPLSDLCIVRRTKLGGFGYGLERNIITDFQSMVRSKISNQTYCIPFRIMMNLWSDYIQYIDGFDKDFNVKHFSLLCSVIDAFYESQDYSDFLANNSKKDKLSHYRSKFIYNEAQEILKTLYEESCPIVKRMISYDSMKRWRKKVYLIDFIVIRDVHSQLTLYVTNCIQAMTGMRLSEVKGILHNGLIEDDGRIGVVSTLQKFAEEGGRTEEWAAAPFVKTAFNVLFEFNRVMLGFKKNELDSMPLAICCKTWLRSRKIKPIYSQRQSDWTTNLVAGVDKYTLTEEDVVEFKLLNKNIGDMDRVSQEIYVGAPWPVKSHQYRRSIAVHSRRLSLVSNNTLLHQYKHLVSTMTDWYISGWDSMNEEVQKIPEAFAKELQELEIELSAELAVKLQNEKGLIGEGGKELMKQ